MQRLCADPVANLIKALIIFSKGGELKRWTKNDESAFMLNRMPLLTTISLRATQADGKFPCSYGPGRAKLHLCFHSNYNVIQNVRQHDLHYENCIIS